MDDFLRATLAKHAEVTEYAFREVHKMLGIPLKVGKEDMGERLPVLGHILAATPEWVGLAVEAERQGELTTDLQQATRQGLQRQEPKQQGGRLTVASEASHGRVGRAHTSAVINARTRPATGPVITT